MTWRLILRLLTGEAREAELVGLRRQMRSDRARQHAALADLLQTARLDFRVLWAALLERTRTEACPS
jgi:hypothetical protein